MTFSVSVYLMPLHRVDTVVDIFIGIEICIANLYCNSRMTEVVVHVVIILCVQVFWYLVTTCDARWSNA